jgi:hypothetical protein
MSKPITMLDLCKAHPEKAAERIDSLIKRNAVLEKERDELLQRTECTVESFNMEAHNLEQRAQGVKNFISPYETDFTLEFVKGGYGPVVLKSGKKEIKNLLDQAKALRGQP